MLDAVWHLWKAETPVSAYPPGVLQRAMGGGGEDDAKKNAVTRLDHHQVLLPLENVMKEEGTAEQPFPLVPMLSKMDDDTAASSSRKAAFLASTDGEGYGYNGRIDELRSSEFSRLKAGSAYLDHAGAPPYSESLLRDAFAVLERSLLGNPHSLNDAAGASAAAVDAARNATLAHFNAPCGEYACIFSAGATAALRAGRGGGKQLEEKLKVGGANFARGKTKNSCSFCGSSTNHFKLPSSLKKKTHCSRGRLSNFSYEEAKKDVLLQGNPVRSWSQMRSLGRSRASSGTLGRTTRAS